MDRTERAEVRIASEIGMELRIHERNGIVRVTDEHTSWYANALAFYRDLNECLRLADTRSGDDYEWFCGHFDAPGPDGTELRERYEMDEEDDG